MQQPHLLLLLLLQIYFCMFQLPKYPTNKLEYSPHVRKKIIEAIVVINNDVSRCKEDRPALLRR